MLGKNNLLRTNLIITDGDSQEFNAVDESFFLYFRNAICDRCGYHIIEKSYKDHVSGNNIFINEEKAKCIISEIKIWVRSWMNGDTCLHHNQYEMSKNMLLSYIGHDKDFLSIIGTFSKNCLLSWLNSYVIVHENYYAFHRKKEVLHFHEYVNNATEGMNYSCKKSSVSAKPNHSIKQSAQSMESYSTLKDVGKLHYRYYQNLTTPLYFATGSVHEIANLKYLVTVAQHMVIDQYKVNFRGLFMIIFLILSK